MSNTIATRKHKVLATRNSQLALNILAAKGGRPYIDERLWRAPNESDISWTGNIPIPNSAATGTVSSFYSVGRKQRAALVNDAGRVVSKITQYLFKTSAERKGIDEVWAKDVTGGGESVGNFWVLVSEMLTASQWVWLHTDRMGALIDPETGEARERTLLEKQRDSDVVRWEAWPSVSVPDWSFDAGGALRWLITEGVRYDNADPFADPTEYRVRTLWHKGAGGVTVTQFLVESSTGAVTQNGEPTVTGMKEIPFVLVGTPSSDPWRFDDVEGLQAHLLNLDSLHYENLVKTVFPQLIITRSTLEGLEMRLVERMGANNGQRMVEVVREVIRGLDTPIVEAAEESGITRFIQPAAGDQKTLPDEIQRKRQLLFDMVGLSLFNKETRQIQTAESKQFDQLDTESTLKHRSRVMQEAEERLVALSKEIDPGFREYVPVWPTSFDVVDAQGDSAVVTMMENLPDATPSMRKLALMGALRILAEVGGYDHALIDQARKEIAATSFDASDATDLLDGDSTGKIPLAIQQLALARERAKNAGDEAMAAKLGSKIDELTARI